jgi:hypothetical protein
MNTQSQFSTPILFLIFNRPDTTQKVFDTLRQAHPQYLFSLLYGIRYIKLFFKDNLKLCILEFCKC